MMDFSLKGGTEKELFVGKRLHMLLFLFHNFRTGGKANFLALNYPFTLCPNFCRVDLFGFISEIPWEV